MIHIKKRAKRRQIKEVSHVSAGWADARVNPDVWQKLFIRILLGNNGAGAEGEGQNE